MTKSVETQKAPSMPLLTRREAAVYSVLSSVSQRNLLGEAKRVRARVFWGADEMNKFRVRRLRATVEHAVANVPYYQRIFRDSGIHPSDIKSFSDLSSIPPLTRNTLRDNFQALRSTRVPDSAVLLRSTGGTSGEPVTVALDRSGAPERMLANHRMYWMMGRHIGASTLMIAGSPVDSIAWTSFRDRVKNFIFGVDVISSFNLTPSILKTIVERLANKRYEWVIAYVSVFDILAAYIQEHGVRIHIPNIIPCAELVTTTQRNRWSEIFGCRVFEIYGSREMTSIAGELPHNDGLAVTIDMYHLEITDEKGKELPYGTPGLITISTLTERGMPLLRYQLGDVGVLTPTPSEGPFLSPRLHISHGRVLDVIRCPNGKLLPGEFFPHLIKEVEYCIQSFQVEQLALDQLVVRLVPRSSISSTVLEYLRSHIASQIGQGVSIEFKIVANIETSKSGKFRPTISRISTPVQEGLRVAKIGDAM